MADIGYIRISLSDQNIARQLDGLELEETFIDKASGKTKDRPALKECLRYVRKGDTLHIHSMDRLAKNLLDLQTIVQDLTNRDIQVKFYKENLCFSGKDEPFSVLMLQIMGAVAQFERQLIREKQFEGIKLAKKRGQKWGPPPKVTIKKLLEIRRLIEEGISKKDIAKKFNISRTTLYKAIKPFKERDRDHVI